MCQNKYVWSKGLMQIQGSNPEFFFHPSCLSFAIPRGGRSSLINVYPDDKILNQAKLKAFADDKPTVAYTVNSVFEWMETFMEKDKKSHTSGWSVLTD